METLKVKFKKWDCIIIKKKYAEGKRICLALVDSNDGSPVATATVNIPDEWIEQDEVIIKDWSENKGMYKSLLKAGIISEQIRIVPTGFVYGIVCKLLI